MAKHLADKELVSYLFACSANSTLLCSGEVTSSISLIIEDDVTPFQGYKVQQSAFLFFPLFFFLKEAIELFSLVKD